MFSNELFILEKEQLTKAVKTNTVRIFPSDIKSDIKIQRKKVT